ncbi:MAG: hypothetical protein KDA72_09905 [Planctomycetales bacterium]|nr:hypothetical protein [Planctomycetales bacterium]
MHWRLSEASAMGVAGASQIEVFPSSPAQAARWQVVPNSTSVCAWEFASVMPHPPHASLPEEVYSREGDLIVRYRQSPADTFAYQLDWQLLPATAPFVAAVELWLSVQTDLLDTEPELEIACSARSGQHWQVFEHRQLSEPDSASQKDSAAVARGPAALLCSPLAENANVDSAHSGLWLIEPSDQCNTRRCTKDDQTTQRLRLFGHFMEKGVIRRARMRFLLAAGSVSAEHISHAYRELADSPLPLTA